MIARVVCVMASTRRRTRLAASQPYDLLVLDLRLPRRSGIEVLRSLPEDRRIGIGVVNQKHARVESVEEIVEIGRAHV